MRKKLFIATFLVTGFSLVSFANEAPVVDAQSGMVASTQPEASSGSSGWQTVSNENQPAATAASATVSNNKSAPVTQQEWAPAQQNAAALAENGSVNQRVARLEQQMSNYTQMNLPQQVSDMQQKISQLQGQMEVDQREIKKLTDQQKTYYQDLEQQISQNQSQHTTTKTASAAPAKKINTALAESNAATATTVTSSDNRNADDNNTANTTVQNNADQNQAPSLGDANAYDKAFRLLSRKHFNQARASFNDYLQNYPNGRFAVNAHFWLGEIALMNQNYDVAKKQFKTVVTKYPTSIKVSDAKLKIAMIHAAKGQTVLAKKEFNQIRKDYPGSTAAQLASIRLQQISGGVS